ncbi:6-carboxytetrahydropterin synthase QueD [Nannocystis pusilla]|uniref:6-carboxy-5,6,7,8-tetrahydropterin synthase n=1 Tax=Nannocystis pusilla TaxID=889268 RepID=A0A9X3IUQ8_9BACT|nr:6-carboxytetrahydropterin synthase QueD [Nannocystis pusilla]MCY1004120.1 6-carboxytetrahydropterin synthase QueD [Nannocystis pusilla]
MEIYRVYHFEAAHRLPAVPPGHKCARLHGHSYAIDVRVRGPVGADTGWIMDLGDLDVAWEPLHRLLDHHYLNEVEGLENPTSELLARWIWRRLKPSLPLLCEVGVRETCTCGCIYRGEDEDDRPPAA